MILLKALTNQKVFLGILVLIVIGLLIWTVRKYLGFGLINMTAKLSEPEEPSRNYEFSGYMPQEVLKNYLSRAVTHAGLCSSSPDLPTWCFDEDLQMLVHIGAKFIGRAAFAWSTPLDEEAHFQMAKQRASKVHQTDPEIILQACVFEAVFKDLGKIPIPAWVFEEFNMQPEKRNFNYDAMLYGPNKGVNFWGSNGSIPDMSKTETKLWFFYRAARYIDCGFEAIHFGQFHLMNGNDPGFQHWMELLTRVRAYATKHARRQFVLCDAHTHGATLNNKLLFDFHSFPIGFNIKDENGMKTGELVYGMRKGGNWGIVGRSRGGIAPSGWKTKSLPYVVEFDNADPKDDICWFSKLSEEDRNKFLRYAWNWVSEQDMNGFVQFPTRRILAVPAVVKWQTENTIIPSEIWKQMKDEAYPVKMQEKNGKKEISMQSSFYRANTPSPEVPNGFNQEETIRDIWQSSDD